VASSFLSNLDGNKANNAYRGGNRVDKILFTSGQPGSSSHGFLFVYKQDGVNDVVRSCAFNYVFGEI